MEKNIEIGLLYEFYNKLLTQKQSYIINSYYNDDLSLSEIADDINISRQGVRKQLKDAENALYNYEEKMCLLKNYLINKQKIDEINNELEKLKEKSDCKLIDDLKNRINQLI